MSLQTLISGFVRYQNNSQEKGSFLVSKSRLTSFSTGVERFGHDLHPNLLQACHAFHVLNFTFLHVNVFLADSVSGGKAAIFSFI